MNKNTNPITVLMTKDIKQVLRNRQLWLPMLIVSLTFSVLLPVLIFWIAKYAPDSIHGMDKILKNIPGGLPYKDNFQNLIYVSVNYIFPSYFILIPIMTGSMLGAGSFVGEREKKTLESLFYTPMSPQQLFWSKLWGVFIPAYGITLLSFVLFGIVINTAGFIYFSKLLFPTPLWLILMFWLSPILAFLGLSLLVLLSSKFQTYQEAVQMSGLLVLPFLIVVLGQTTGLFFLQPWMLIIAGLLLLITTIILIRFGIRNFDPEKLV